MPIYLKVSVIMFIIGVIGCVINAYAGIKWENWRNHTYSTFLFYSGCLGLIVFAIIEVIKM